MKNQGSIFQQESGQNPNQISTLRLSLEAQQLGPRSGALSAHYPTLCWRLGVRGTGLPLPEPPGQAAARSAHLLGPKVRRAGKNWHVETQRFL